MGARDGVMVWQSTYLRVLLLALSLVSASGYQQEAVDQVVPEIAIPETALVEATGLVITKCVDFNPASAPVANSSVVNPQTALPTKWHDSDGPHFDCDWYGERLGSSGNRCATYGDQYQFFGQTANQACCGCGGGTI